MIFRLQKVEYVKAEYNSSLMYTSVVRSCSVGICMSTNYTEYSRCLGKDRYYRVYGCSTRTCCDDMDLCNSGPLKSPNMTILLWISLFAFLKQMCVVCYIYN